MTPHEKRAIALSAAILMLGFFIAVHWKAGHLFARSGALISVVAVVFASLQLRSRIAQSSSFVDEQLRLTRGELLKQAAEAGLDAVRSEEVVERVAREIRKEVGDVTQEVSRRLYLVELWLFIVGTLIWGYADLPLDWWLAK